MHPTVAYLAYLGWDFLDETGDMVSIVGFSNRIILTVLGHFFGNGHASIANIFILGRPPESPITRDDNTSLYVHVDVYVMSNGGVPIELRDCKVCTFKRHYPFKRTAGV
jgi:hypothetical protein